MQQRPRGTSAPADLALVAVFAALVAVLALVPAIPVGGVGVPLTLQTLGVLLAGLVLGPWRGFAATLLYVVVGLAGLPVFAGGTGGLGALQRPSVGYLLSFPLAALVAGALAAAGIRRGWRPRYLWLFLSGIGASLLVVHPAGILGIAAVTSVDLRTAFLADAVFWPGDVVKSLLAAGIALAVHRAFPALLTPPRTLPA